MSASYFSFLIKSSICLAVFYLLYWILFKNEKTFQFNRYYLLVSILFSLVLPIISILDFLKDNTQNGFNLFINSNIIKSSLNATVLNEETYAATENSSSLPFIFWLKMIYFTILIILTLRLMLSILKLSRLFKTNPIQKKLEFTLVYLKDGFFPFSFLKYIFVHDKLKNSDTLDKIIEHEKIHVKQNHSFDIILIEIILIIQWYNPFIWLIRKSIKEIHEFLADEKVIAQGFDSESYSLFLLNQIVGVKAMDFANCFNQSLIKRRITMMKKIGIGKLANVKKILIFPLALLILVFLLMPSNGITNNNILAKDYVAIGSSDQIPKGWSKAGMDPAAYEIIIDSKEIRNGNKSVLIQSLNPKGEKDFGNLMQTISADNFLGKRIRLKGEIKTKDVDKGAAYWLRIDGEKVNLNTPSFLGMDNMMDRAPKGTSDWKEYEIVLDVPQTAKTINIGMMLVRTGKAWFSNIKLEEVDESVPVTKPPLFPQIPKQPVNLNFNEK